MPKYFMGGYKTYTGPRGNPGTWRRAFGQRMGIDEAKRTIGSGTPRSILGLAAGVKDWDVIKKAYRALAMQHHPDRGGDPVLFRKVQAAFELLELEFGKG